MDSSLCVTLKSVIAILQSVEVGLLVDEEEEMLLYAHDTKFAEFAALELAPSLDDYARQPHNH